MIYKRYTVDIRDDRYRSLDSYKYLCSGLRSGFGYWLTACGEKYKISGMDLGKIQFQSEIIAERDYLLKKPVLSFQIPMEWGKDFELFICQFIGSVIYSSDFEKIESSKQSFKIKRLLGLISGDFMTGDIVKAKSTARFTNSLKVKFGGSISEGEQGYQFEILKDRKYVVRKYKRYENEILIEDDCGNAYYLPADYFEVEDL
jgi:hypothetical protein